MALSKLAIALIAGIGSVVAVGGVAAGLVVSRQNSNQTVQSTDESKNPSSKQGNKNDSLNKQAESKKDDSTKTLVDDANLTNQSSQEEMITNEEESIEDKNSKKHQIDVSKESKTDVENDAKQMGENGSLKHKPIAQTTTLTQEQNTSDKDMDGEKDLSKVSDTKQTTTAVESDGDKEASEK